MIKVGDRVRATHTNPCLANSMIGDEGTVIGITTMFGTIDPVIEFDRHVGGHDGGCVAKGKDGHCWLMESEWVEVIPPEETE